MRGPRNNATPAPVLPISFRLGKTHTLPWMDKGFMRIYDFIYYTDDITATRQNSLLYNFLPLALFVLEFDLKGITIDPPMDAE
jgi:hypothetical protein